MRPLACLLALTFPLLPATVAAELDVKPIDAVVERALKELQAPGAAAVVVKGDEVVHLKGYGVKKLGSEAAVTPDTVFPIASCSKAFTATLLGMAIDEGRARWDDHVTDFLPGFRLADPSADREVTLRDLLCHRTGMPRHDALWAGLTNNTGELILRWTKANPSTPFRTTWEYTNVPFTTASLISGTLFNGGWNGAVRKRIFEPLGMTTTSSTFKAGQLADDRADLHYLTFDKQVKPAAWDEIDHALGAGCINSTARDMGQWLRCQLNDGKLDGKQVIPAAVIKETRTQQMLVKPTGAFVPYFPEKAGRFTTYGLGWFVHEYRGNVCVSHGGTLTGLRAQVMMVPDKKVAVFVVCNLKPCFLPEAVAKTVLDQLLGLPAEDWVAFYKGELAKLDQKIADDRKKRDDGRKPDTKPVLPLPKYAGRYEQPAYGRVEIAEKDGELTLKWGKYAFRLEHFQFDTFTGVMTEPKAEVYLADRSTYEVQFRIGPNGEVDAVKFMDQVFTRLPPPPEKPKEKEKEGEKK